MSITYISISIPYACPTPTGASLLFMTDATSLDPRHAKEAPRLPVLLEAQKANAYADVCVIHLLQKKYCLKLRDTTKTLTVHMYVKEDIEDMVRVVT